MNEAQTKHDLIEPALRKAGWGKVEGSRLRLEFPITQGRLLGQGRKSKPLFADYVLEYKNRRIGVVEAKKRDLYYTDGEIDTRLDDNGNVILKIFNLPVRHLYFESVPAFVHKGIEMLLDKKIREKKIKDIIKDGEIENLYYV